jgi:uncharacterized protein YigE (DUF2233 family)
MRTGWLRSATGAVIVAGLVTGTVSPTARAEGAKACAPVRYLDNSYTVCQFDVRRDQIELFWRDGAKEAFGSFRRLRQHLSDQGKELSFAMNAGMYNEQLAPIGLYVERSQSLKSANQRDGPGNFHLKPNGIFYMAGGKAGVAETGAFTKSGIKPRIASQSGPMLVIDGKLHPRFLKASTSRKRRNGVGVKDGGNTVIFVISEDFVTFHQFGSLFRDHLKTPNALFFDGTISSLYAPDLSRVDWGRPMGPIVGVVRDGKK